MMWNHLKYIITFLSFHIANFYCTKSIQMKKSDYNIKQQSRLHNFAKVFPFARSFYELFIVRIVQSFWRVYAALVSLSRSRSPSLSFRLYMWICALFICRLRNNFNFSAEHQHAWKRPDLKTSVCSMRISLKMNEEVEIERNKKNHEFLLFMLVNWIYQCWFDTPVSSVFFALCSLVKSSLHFPNEN